MEDYTDLERPGKSFRVPSRASEKREFRDELDNLLNDGQTEDDYMLSNEFVEDSGVVYVPTEVNEQTLLTENIEAIFAEAQSKRDFLAEVRNGGSFYGVRFTGLDGLDLEGSEETRVAKPWANDLVYGDSAEDLAHANLYD
tara:strand:- start:2818 stop:3240 length:423 start_codon:yes stop_codon:yes gene_type:complete